MKGFLFFKRHLILLSTCLLAVGVIVPIAAFANSSTHAGGSPNGGGATSTSKVGQASGLSLSPFAVKKLSGGTTVVVHDGDQLLEGTTDTNVLSGFTVHAGDVAKTTWVVADGQCGTDSAPLPCVNGRPTNVGSGDTAGFTGGHSSLTIGPDAFRGHDRCPWGPDTCLWDTLTTNVTPYVAPGDTSVKTTVTSGNPSSFSYDCLNHIAQVFSTGPKAAAASEGYVAAGVGLRNQGSGHINLSGIPAHSRIVQALLYWTTLNPSNPGGAMNLNGKPIKSTLINGDQADPCWNAGTTWTFRSDVTAQVASAGGNGTYKLSGYPTGSTSGLNPWDNASLLPMAEGASLIVIYSSAKWGVDSFNRITTNFYNQIATTFGQPDFFGRKIGDAHTAFVKDSKTGNPCLHDPQQKYTTMNAAEVQTAHNLGLAVLPFYFSFPTLSAYDDAPGKNGIPQEKWHCGEKYAKAIIAFARSAPGFDIKKGTAIFVDIENTDKHGTPVVTDADFIQGWFDTFNTTWTYTSPYDGSTKTYQAGYYKAGYYANTRPSSSNFATQFCVAVNKEAAIGTHSSIWTTQPNKATLSSTNPLPKVSKKANAPTYTPLTVSCPPPTERIPTPAAWQYAINSLSNPYSINVDIDEALPDLPLWHP